MVVVRPARGAVTPGAVKPQGPERGAASRCVGALRRSLPAGHPDIASAALELGQPLREQGRTGDAPAFLREALEIRGVCHGPESPQAMEIAEALAGMHLQGAPRRPRIGVGLGRLAGHHAVLSSRRGQWENGQVPSAADAFPRRTCGPRSARAVR